MTELDRLIMLYTGDKPDGSRVRGEWGLSSEDHQKLTNFLIEERKRLRVALEFYADERNWEHYRIVNSYGDSFNVLDDGGERAKEALK